MALPATEREVYSRNPLAEVVMDLKFPPILRIETETPAQFQEQIRNDYPRYRRVISAGQLSPEVPAPIRNLIQGMNAVSGPIKHQFEAQDQSWMVSLSREHLALKTTKYTRWEEFRERANRLRTAFTELYRPASYARIGLRYVDIVRRSILQLGDVSWAELLKPQIAGELAAEELGENVDSMSRQLHCKLDDDNCFLTLKTGIAVAEPDSANANKEKCFLIDADFHTHKLTELNHVMVALDSFNRASGNLFRWAILPRLRAALEPKSLQ